MIFIFQEGKLEKRKVKQFGWGLRLENTEELGLGLAVLLRC